MNTRLDRQMYKTVPAKCTMCKNPAVEVEEHNVLNKDAKDKNTIGKFLFCVRCNKKLPRGWYL